MKILIEAKALTTLTPGVRTVSVEYDGDARSRSRIMLITGMYSGDVIDGIVLTHQEARALGHALLTDAARAQKELEG